MVSFVILRYPVNTLVTAFNNPDKLTQSNYVFKHLLFWNFADIQSQIIFYLQITFNFKCVRVTYFVSDVVAL